MSRLQIGLRGVAARVRNALRRAEDLLSSGGQERRALLFPLVLLVIGVGCQASSEKSHHTGLVPSNLGPHELHAQARAHSHDPQRASELLSHAREMDPVSGEIALDLGVSLLRLGRYGEAKVHLEDAEELLPESPGPHYNLAWLHHELGQLDSAGRAYERALQLAPDDAEILENLLLVYTELGTQHRRRIELIDRALLADPDPQWQDWLRLQRHLLLAFAEEEEDREPEQQQPPDEGEPEGSPPPLSPDADTEAARLFPTLPTTRHDR